MSLIVYQVDAFTDRPFAGNPAAVCLLAKPVEPSWMQDLAREMNLAETAYVRRHDDGFDLRWFTPAVEVDLCGHATLASAHVLWETGTLRPEEAACFETRSGPLTASRADGLIELDFPADDPAPYDPPRGLIEAMGVAPVTCVRGRQYVLLELASEEAVRSVRPQFQQLAALGLEVIITSRAESGDFDFVSRFFAPSMGVDEDPVTGSAHCTLGPFWAERLGQEELVGYQASARGGRVWIRVDGARAALRGHAVTIGLMELTETAMPHGGVQ